MTTYLVLAMVATFTLGFLVVFLLLGGRSQESKRLMEVTSGLESAPSASDTSRLRSLLDPDRIVQGVRPLRRLIGTAQDPELLRRLASAGYRKASHAEIFQMTKVVVPAVAALSVFFLAKQSVFFWVVIAAAIGYLLPDVWLMLAISRRQQRVRLSLPDSLDLLVICLEAGLGLDQAMVRVGHEMRLSHPDLSEEFLLINLEQRAGKPRVDAWRHMADRTGVDSVRQFVQMLVQTERFGTPISRSLGTFADGLRVRRRQQAEEMAAKTTIKLIPPLVFFIFPSLFIVLLGPAVLTIFRNLGKALSGE